MDFIRNIALTIAFVVVGFMVVGLTITSLYYLIYWIVRVVELITG